jgi:hypothetical protein
MSTAAQYASTINSAHAQVSVANTARDGSGTLATVISAGATGTRIDDIAIVATGTTTAGVIRLFLHDGTNARLWKEILVAAITPSTTQAVWSQYLYDLGLALKTGWSLRASTNNAETFNVEVTRAGDL